MLNPVAAGIVGVEHEAGVTDNPAVSAIVFKMDRIKPRADVQINRLKRPQSIY